MNRMMQIPELFLPLEPIAIWDNGFDDTEIENIISIGELSEFSKGRVGTSDNDISGELNENIRDTDIIFIEPSEETQWLYTRMSEFCAKINYDKFQFDLHNFQPLQYGKYKVDGHYDWHVDCGPNLPEHRKLSFVLGLSDPDDYKGGVLELNLSGNAKKPHKIKLKKGHLVVFPSYIPHRVTKVTEGERLTLVGWAVGPKFK